MFVQLKEGGFYHKGKCINNEILKHLSYYVESQGKFKDIIEFLYSLNDSYLTFVEEIFDESIKPYLVEEEMIRESNCGKIKFLEVGKSIYIFDHENVGEERLEFTGIGIDDKYALSLEQWANLSNFDIKINDKVDVIKGDSVLTEYQYDFTLYDFLSAIFNEICFYGSLRRREKTLTELENRLEEIHDGSVKLSSFEEVMERLKAK